MTYQATAKELDSVLSEIKTTQSLLDDVQFKKDCRLYKLQIWVSKKNENNRVMDLPIAYRNSEYGEPKIAAGMDMIILGFRKYLSGRLDQLEAREAVLRSVLASEVKS